MKKSFLFASESVTEGHPDKMADQISDAVLDYIIARDKNARVACETLVSNGFCVIAGELKTSVYAPMQEIARKVVQEIGYTDALYGFDYRSAAVLNGIGEQSPDINQGVDRADGEIGAGDQGLMFGYACRETPSLMPLPIWLSHRLTEGLAAKRKDGSLPFLRPDGKSQVTVRYEDGVPVAIDTIVISTQHSPETQQTHLRDAVIEEIVQKVLPAKYLNDNIRYFVNPTGKFVIGGPLGDTGLTGRKIIVDTYGGYARHGGGSFSGKDPSKVDRSAAYMARYIAKNMVAAGVANRMEVQLSYAIGKPDPLSINISTFKTSKYSDDVILGIIRKVFDCRPGAIIKNFSLTQPTFKYRSLATYGHFGRPDLDLPYEKLDKVEEIKEILKSL